MIKVLAISAAGCALLAGGVQAEGYLVDSDGSVVFSGGGECWHTSGWSPDDARVPCDGAVAAVAPVEPEPAALAAVEPALQRFTLDGETYFAFDKAQLRPEASDKLDALVRSLQEYDEVLGVRIVGHADQIGDPQYNERLSRERAESVRQFLVERGRVDPGVLTVQSKGESEPQVQCEGKQGQALIECLAPNRRVELEVEAVKSR